MKIKLQTGKEVYLQGFHCTPTYAGLLFGEPTIESNKRLIKDLSYPSEWGKRVTILKKSYMYISENNLKPILNCVWLSSDPFNNEFNQFNGSSIVVIWFSNKQLDKSITEIIVDGVGDIVWEEFAENYQF
jgi:hypothetical protein